MDSLDLEAMGFEHTVPAPTARPPYNPYDLVKLYVYGYLNKIRSSRRLMRECRRNIELWFLLNRLVSDFRTIADFRKAHRKLPKKIFLIFARECREMKLMDAETLCLDGTTVRAVNGRKQSTNVELSRKKLEYAKAQLAAVEAKSHMIADFNISDSRSDKGQLCASMQMCMKNLELDSVRVIADKGYESAADIKDCLMNGIVPDVGFIQDREERVFLLDYVEQDITPEMKASTKPEDIQIIIPSPYTRVDTTTPLHASAPCRALMGCCLFRITNATCRPRLALSQAFPSPATTWPVIHRGHDRGNRGGQCANAIFTAGEQYVIWGRHIFAVDVQS